MIEFKDEEIRREYDYLKMQEEDLRNELEVIEERIRNLEENEETY